MYVRPPFLTNTTNTNLSILFNSLLLNYNSLNYEYSNLLLYLLYLYSNSKSKLLLILTLTIINKRIKEINSIKRPFIIYNTKLKRKEKEKSKRI